MVSDSDAKDNPAEKREHPRAVVKIEIEFKDIMDFISSYMINISNGGLFIKTDDAFPLDTIVLLLFTMPGDSQPIETEGKVVWCNTKGGKGYFPKGMGVKFLRLNPDDNEKILKFVEKHFAQIQSHSFL